MNSPSFTILEVLARSYSASAQGVPVSPPPQWMMLSIPPNGHEPRFMQSPRRVSRCEIRPPLAAFVSFLESSGSISCSFLELVVFAQRTDKSIREEMGDLFAHDLVHCPNKLVSRGVVKPEA